MHGKRDHFKLDSKHSNQLRYYLVLLMGARSWLVLGFRNVWLVVDPCTGIEQCWKSTAKA
jgi:hypothetical protein